MNGEGIKAYASDQSPLGYEYEPERGEMIARQIGILGFNFQGIALH